jgi:hypothetical protein
VAAASRQGKPLLTEAAINHLLTELRAQGRHASQKAVGEATRDLKRFLQERFLVAREQEAELDVLDPRSRAELNGAIEQGFASRNRFFVRITRRPGGEPTLSRQKGGPNDHESRLATVEVTVTRTPNQLGGLDVEAEWLKI